MQLTLPSDVSRFDIHMHTILFHNLERRHSKIYRESSKSEIQNWNMAELKIDTVKNIDKGTASDPWGLFEGWSTIYKSGVLNH